MKMKDESVKAIIKMRLFLFSINFPTTVEFFLLQIDFKKSTNKNKYIKTTKFLRKPLISTPLKSKALNGS